MITPNPKTQNIQIFFVDETNIKKIQNQKLIEDFDYKPNYGQILIDQSNHTILIGLQLKKLKTVDRFYKVNYFELGAKLGNELKKTKLNNFEINDFEGSKKEMVDFILGFNQAYYKFDKYISKSKSITPKFVATKKIKSLLGESEVKYLENINYYLNLARDLVMDTPEEVNPTSMPEIIEGELTGLRNTNLEIFNAKKIDQMGLNAISYVGRASRHEPKLIHAVLKPAKKNKKKLVLVGKGVTYDSGGYSIKPAEFMSTMKSDMAGSATMFAVFATLSKLEILTNIELHWYSAFVENMIDGSGYKPDDVITTLSGQTIEIINTDAEGRLTLCECLTLATLLDPDYIIDAATLTGAAIRSHSEQIMPMMSNDRDFQELVYQSFLENNEKAVIDELSEVHREDVLGTYTDLINTAKTKYAGHISAAGFLSHFVDQSYYKNTKILDKKEPKAYPWVHLDIAGTAFNKKTNLLNYDGATGYGIRSLVDLIIKLDESLN
jgi:leucyl aminopeptidase